MWLLESKEFLIPNIFWIYHILSSPSPSPQSPVATGPKSWPQVQTKCKKPKTKLFGLGLTQWSHEPTTHHRLLISHPQLLTMKLCLFEHPVLISRAVYGIRHLSAESQTKTNSHITKHQFQFQIFFNLMQTIKWTNFSFHQS